MGCFIKRERFNRARQAANQYKEACKRCNRIIRESKKGKKKRRKKGKLTKEEKATAFCLEARCLWGQKKYVRAEFYVREALAVDPENGQAHELLLSWTFRLF